MQNGRFSFGGRTCPIANFVDTDLLVVFLILPESFVSRWSLFWLLFVERKYSPDSFSHARVLSAFLQIFIFIEHRAEEGSAVYLPDVVFHKKAANGYFLMIQCSPFIAGYR